MCQSEKIGGGVLDRASELGPAGPSVADLVGKSSLLSVTGSLD